MEEDESNSTDNTPYYIPRDFDDNTEPGFNKEEDEPNSTDNTPYYIPRDFDDNTEPGFNK